MGQKDLYQSDFYEDKGRFADVFNGVLFDGRMVMKPEELETVDSVITEQVKPFVNDFKLNLFDYHDSTDFSRFQTENRLLFEMLSCQKDKEKMKEVLKRHSADSMVDKESAKAILGISNEKVNLKAIMKKDEHDREVYDMCQAFEDYKEEGRTEGRIEGRIEGREEACEKIISIMKELNVAAEIIREKLMEKYFFSVSEVDEKMKKYY